ncbi:VOC family protein [Actinocorallia aurea]
MEHDRYPLGAPCWVELSAQDIDGAEWFYGSLFGWEVHRLPAGFPVFTLDGAPVGGLWPEPISAGAASWAVYFSVEDIGSTSALVEDAGGRVVIEPWPLEDYGVLAGYLDREHVHFMAWEPRTRHGARVSGESFTWAWPELVTRDMDAATSFYPRVFGWGRTREGEQTRWTVEGQPVAGLYPVPPEAPDEVVSSWVVHFAVPDLARWSRRAEDLGAQRLVDVDDPVFGPSTAFADPQDAVFVLVPASTVPARVRRLTPGSPAPYGHRIVTPP